jgi:hypothetical protein
MIKIYLFFHTFPNIIRFGSKLVCCGTPSEKNWLSLLCNSSSLSSFPSYLHVGHVFRTARPVQFILQNNRFCLEQKGFFFHSIVQTVYCCCFISHQTKSFRSEVFFSVIYIRQTTEEQNLNLAKSQSYKRSRNYSQTRLWRTARDWPFLFVLTWLICVLTLNQFLKTKCSL